MSKINLTPNAGGTGTLTVTSPNTNTDYTLTLPSGTGTFNISGTPNEVPAGTVSAPSIYFSGDTNTGIYSPGSDTIAFTEGGVEAMRLDSSGNVLVGTTSASTPSSTGFISTANTFGFKNRIINGAMQIDQRNAGASVSASGVFTVDRWYVGELASRFTAQRNAGSVTPPAGFTNYLGITSTSAYSIGASERYGIFQGIEGFNISDLGWGGASAKAVTLSFWVRSSLTGTFGGVAANSAFNRCYVFSYTINAANTWEQKTITIPGDTTGTWLTDNSLGLSLSFAVAVGSSGQTTPGSWGSVARFAPTGQVNVAGTNGATFYITGVQLEVGTVATSFDVRPYTTEFQLCQRYFELSPQVYGTVNSTGNAYTSWFFKVTKRATPTITYSGGSTVTTGAVDTNAVNSYSGTGVFPLINTSSTASIEL